MKPLRLLAAAAVAVAAVSASPVVAQAREPQPQNNEIAFDVDATFGKSGNNDSNLLLVYSWIPGALDQNDEVVPALRRFVRQPSELNVRLQRQGDSYDSVTGLYGGGTAWLPGGTLFGSLDLGLEYDKVENEPFELENAFIAGSGRIEVGGRVLPLLQLSAFYRYRPVLLPLPETTASNVEVERSGATHEAGVGFGFATSDDRLLLGGGLGYRAIDWTFTDFHAGTIQGRALFASLRLSLQSSPKTSWFLRGEAATTDWINLREKQPDFTGLGTEGNVRSLQADAGLVYWFEGHWGFRISFGGGYIGQGPLLASQESGLFRVGVGFTTRY